MSKPLPITLGACIYQCIMSMLRASEDKDRPGAEPVDLGIHTFTSSKAAELMNLQRLPLPTPALPQDQADQLDFVRGHMVSIRVPVRPSPGPKTARLQSKSRKASQRSKAATAASTAQPARILPSPSPPAASIGRKGWAQQWIGLVPGLRMGAQADALPMTRPVAVHRGAVARQQQPALHARLSGLCQAMLIRAPLRFVR